MLNRLVITGLPCPPETWEAFLGPMPKQRILPIREVFDHTDSSDPREMARYVMDVIAKERPKSILCHDLGVPLTILSLLRLRRQGIALDTRLTIFNGALRRVSLLKAAHPWRIQWMTERRVVREVESRGGKVDLGLHPHLPRIRRMYRLIILYRFAEKMTSFLGMEDLAGLPTKARLKTPVQFLASTNDPYLPVESLHQLKHDLSVDRFVELEYGHFPYSIARERVVPFIEEFEAR